MAGLGPQVTEIDLVAHSLGNLVVRRYYHQQSADDAEGADPRIQAHRDAGAPNHPPARARKFADNAMLGGLYQLVLPETGSDLAYGYPWAEGKLATPACEFGIVAGGKGDGRGYRRACRATTTAPSRSWRPGCPAPPTSWPCRSATPL